MDHLLLVSTVIDVGAVAGLAWLMLRSRRDRDASLGLHQATLDGLRADLSQLVLEAERRAQGLEQMLAGRERALRELIDELARVERRHESRHAPRERDERRGADPAEARLLRDLQLGFGSREA
jgi:hypothetical protein